MAFKEQILYFTNNNYKITYFSNKDDEGNTISKHDLRIDYLNNWFILVCNNLVDSAVISRICYKDLYNKQEVQKLLKN